MMKQTQLILKRIGVAGPSTALTLLTSMAILTPIAIAKKGGKPGGDGGGDGDEMTVNVVPDLVSAPVGYTTTEIAWNGDIDGNGIPDLEDDDFQGVSFNGISNQGIVVSYIGGPGIPDPDLIEVSKLPRVIGGINIDPATGQIADEMFDLNEVFGISLTALNDDLALEGDQRWRIGFGRAITDGGLVALKLIPDWAPYIFAERVPCLLAVGDLSRRLETDAISVIPTDVGGRDHFWQFTQDGHALVFDVREGADDAYFRIFALGVNSQEEWGYFAENEMPMPTPLYWWDGPTINDPINPGDLPELLYTRNFDSTYQLVRYTYSAETADAEEVTLHERVGTIFEAEGLTSNGDAYASGLERATTGKGRNRETVSYWTSYHIVSPTERTPLTNPMVSARIPGRGWSISDARLKGEEEVLIELDATGELQVYKPNFGARFTLPIDPGTQRLVEISAPVSELLGSYNAGYVGYGTAAEPDRVMVLTPDGASIPGQ